MIQNLFSNICLRDGSGRHNGLKIRGALTPLPVQVRPQVPPLKSLSFLPKIIFL